MDNEATELIMRQPTAKTEKNASKPSRNLGSSKPSSNAKRLFCQPAPQLLVQATLPFESPSAAPNILDLKSVKVPTSSSSLSSSTQVTSVGLPDVMEAMMAVVGCSPAPWQDVISSMPLVCT